MSTVNGSNIPADDNPLRNLRKSSPLPEEAPTQSTPRAHTTSVSAPPPNTRDAVVEFARTRLHFHPDEDQCGVLDPTITNGILCCSRQWGKSTIGAVKAVYEAIHHPNSLTLIAAPSGRQSGELVRKCEVFLSTLGIRPRGDGSNNVSVVLPNGARIVGLPENPHTVRGFSAASLLIVDEASRVSKDLFAALWPTTATTKAATGRTPKIWLLSTPYGAQGVFYEIWHSMDPRWTRLSVKAGACPRYTEDDLNTHKGVIGETLFRQEYLCEFTSSDAAVFKRTDLELLLDPDVLPLFPDLNGLNPDTCVRTLPIGHRIFFRHYFVGLDLGRNQDYTTLAIFERTMIHTNRRDAATYKWIPEDRFDLTHLHRLPLGTDYPAIADFVRRLLARRELCDLNQVFLWDTPRRRKPAVSLILDSTGAGFPFYEFLSQIGENLPVRIRPLTITSGHDVHKEKDGWTVPRHILLGEFEALVNARGFHISSRLQLAQEFIREMASLRITSTPSGHTRYQPGSSSEHDDLVFAAAMACFANKRHPTPDHDFYTQRESVFIF